MEEVGEGTNFPPTGPAAGVAHHAGQPSPEVIPYGPANQELEGPPLGCSKTPQIAMQHVANELPVHALGILSSDCNNVPTVFDGGTLDEDAIDVSANVRLEDLLDLKGRDLQQVDGVVEEGNRQGVVPCCS